MANPRATSPPDRTASFSAPQSPTGLSNRRPTLLLWLIAANFFFNLGGGTGKAQDFQVKGTLNVRQLGAQGEITGEDNQSFELTVNGSKWYLSATPYRSTITSGIAGWRIGSEGSNEIYQVTLFDAHLNPNSRNDAVGAVQSDDVPENTQGAHVSELWLAYASGPYFDNITGGMLKPIYNLPGSMRTEGYSLHANYKRFDKPPGLPKSVDYIEDKIIGWRGPTVVFLPLPVPFTNGYVRAEYTVSSHTNVGGCEIPTEFIFKENALVAKDNGARLLTFRAVHGVATNIVPNYTATNFTPGLTRATYISDARLSSQMSAVDSVSYFVTNGQWPPASSPFIRDLHNREKYVRSHMISAAVPPRHGHAPRYVALVILFIVALMPAALLFNHLKRKKQP